jgi:hypothetical protein
MLNSDEKVPTGILGRYKCDNSRRPASHPVIGKWLPIARFLVVLGGPQYSEAPLLSRWERSAAGVELMMKLKLMFSNSSARKTLRDLSWFDSYRILTGYATTRGSKRVLACSWIPGEQKKFLKKQKYLGSRVIMQSQDICKIKNGPLLISAADVAESE